MPAPVPFFLLLCLIEFEVVVLLGERSRSRKDEGNNSEFAVALRDLPENLLAYWLPLVAASAVLLFVAPAFSSGASMAILLGLLVFLIFGWFLKLCWTKRWPGRRFNLYLIQLLTLAVFVYFCFGAILASGFLKSRAVPKAQQLNIEQLISRTSPADCDFVALSDFHIKATRDTSDQLNGFSSPARLQSLLGGLPCKPKLLLISGDLTDRGNPKAWTILTSLIEKSSPGLTVLAAPGNHDISTGPDRGGIAGMAGAYLTFVAEKAPEIRVRSGRNLAEELKALPSLNLTSQELQNLQRQSDEEWNVFAPRDWRGKPIGLPPVLLLERVVQSRREQFWNSLISTAFPLYWVGSDSRTAVIILNSSSGQREDGTAFGDIDDDQLRALVALLDTGLPSSLDTIFILDHHPPTGRSDEILGSGPDRWWFPWSWQGTEIFEYGSLGNQATSGQKLLTILEKAVVQRPNAEFAVISGHRHSLWIGKYGPIWILDPPSLAKEYSDPDRPFPLANRIIAGWHENGRLKIALLPKSNSR